MRSLIAGGTGSLIDRLGWTLGRRAEVTLFSVLLAVL